MEQVFEKVKELFATLQNQQVLMQKERLKLQEELKKADGLFEELKGQRTKLQKDLESLAAREAEVKKIADPIALKAESLALSEKARKDTETLNAEKTKFAQYISAEKDSVKAREQVVEAQIRQHIIDKGNLEARVKYFGLK